MSNRYEALELALKFADKLGGSGEYQSPVQLVQTAELFLKFLDAAPANAVDPDAKEADPDAAGTVFVDVVPRLKGLDFGLKGLLDLGGLTLVDAVQTLEEFVKRLKASEG